MAALGVGPWYCPCVRGYLRIVEYGIVKVHLGLGEPLAFLVTHGENGIQDVLHVSVYHLVEVVLVPYLPHLLFDQGLLSAQGRDFSHAGTV